jgi:hypothetical protein
MSTDEADHDARSDDPLRALVEALLALAESRRWPAVERAAEGTVSAEEIRAALGGFES